MVKPMKTRVRRPASGAVADFASAKANKQADKQEIAASRDGRDITRGWLYPLQLAPVDDTVLLQRGGGDYRTYDEVIRDDTVRAAVNQRVHGVIARPWVVQPGGKRAIDKAAADFLQAELDALQWDNVTAQMLSGVFYGFSVAEIIWRPEGGKVGNDSERGDVKDAILKADADILSASFCDAVATWLTEWNFPGAAVPQVWRVFDDEDLDRRIVRDKAIFDMGFVPSLKYLTETYGGEWQEKPKPEPVDRNNPTGEAVANPLANHAETSGSPIHAEPKDADPTPVTAQVAQMQAEASIAWEEILEWVQALADEAESLEALRERLLSAYGDLPTDELAEIMAMGFAAADLAGRLDVKEESGDGR